MSANPSSNHDEVITTIHASTITENDLGQNCNNDNQVLGNVNVVLEQQSEPSTLVNVGSQAKSMCFDLCKFS